MDGEAHLHLETQVTFEGTAEDKGIEYEAIYEQKKKKFQLPLLLAGVFRITLWGNCLIQEKRLLGQRSSNETPQSDYSTVKPTPSNMYPLAFQYLTLP